VDASLSTMRSNFEKAPSEGCPPLSLRMALGKKGR